MKRITLEIELTEEQEAQMDEKRWEYEETLIEDIETRRQEFREMVNDLKEELSDDLKEIRKDSKDGLKQAIKDLKALWT